LTNENGIRTKAPHLRYWACGIHMQVKHGSEIQLAPGRCQFNAYYSRDFFYSVCITKSSKLRRRRPLCEWLWQREARAAFLVNSN
jgi:hypothetical protein